MNGMLHRNLLLLGVSLIGLNLAAAEGVTDPAITRTFPVQPDGQLTLVIDQGDVEIVTASQLNVIVEVQRDVTDATEAQADKLLKEHKITFTQEDNEVRVRAQSGKPSLNLFTAHNGTLHVHFKITLPRKFNADLVTDGGDIQITGLRGTVEVKTAGGNLTFTRVEGPITAHTSGGDIKAVACTDKLKVETSGGNIMFENTSGPSAQADSFGGNIEAANCTSKLLLKTSGGNITIANYSGPSVYADTGGGLIALDLAEQPAGDCYFRTTGGNITAKLTDTLTVNLTAVTDGGVITSSLPITEATKSKENALSGKLNGGGQLLSFKTGGGNIQIMKR
jgi:DUF4097 and DUF4098 domain-containing protein YvlB